MNIKVVLVWVLAIIIFAILGVFGLVNQNLLLTKNQEPYVPSAGDNTKSCRKKVGNGESSYIFTIDDTTNEITHVTITYKATSLDQNVYAAAQLINNTSINGIEANLSGTSIDFALVLNINVKSFDKVSADNLTDSFMALSMVVDNITDYNAYKQAINALAGSLYTCD